MVGAPPSRPRTRHTRIRANRYGWGRTDDDRRCSRLPDIPTVSESAVRGYEAAGRYGTPARVFTRLNAVVLEALQIQTVHEAFIRQGMDPLTTTPRGFDAYLRSEIAKWTQVVRDADIRPD